MKIQVQLFGAFRKYSTTGTVVVEVKNVKSVKELKQAIASKLKETHSDFKDDELLSLSALATDDEILPDNASISGKTSVAILPPVCGG